jgi:serine/threonine-protein kinase RsbT
MADSVITEIAVRDLHDVPQARRAAEAAARGAGMRALDVGIVALIASEPATNLARYAQEGILSSERAERCVYLESRDQGPGIVHPLQALENGYSTGGGLGIGLGAVKRLTDSFQLDTSPAGTSLKVCKCCAHATL